MIDINYPDVEAKAIVAPLFELNAIVVWIQQRVGLNIISSPTLKFV